jgi:hypothetical protein
LLWCPCEWLMLINLSEVVEKKKKREDIRYQSQKKNNVKGYDCVICGFC